MRRLLLFAILIIVISILQAQTTPFPYSQDFSGEYFPPEEPDWTVRDMLGETTWEGFDGSAVSRSYANMHVFSPDDWLISPPFTFVEGVEYTIRYDVKQGYSYFPNDYMTVYAMTSTAASECVSNNPNNFVLWTGIPPLPWTTFELPFIPTSANAGVRYIAFRHHNCYGQDSIVLDNISIYEVVADDIHAANLTGPGYYNPYRPYTLSVRNNGENDVVACAYTVQVYGATGGGAASALGGLITDTPAIESGEVVTITIPVADWGFNVATETVYNIYAYIDYPPDNTPANNTTDILHITVLPTDIAAVDLMPPNPTLIMPMFPISYFFENSLAQMIYTVEELGGLVSFGEITHFKMRVFDHDIPAHKPVQFYLANAPTTFTAFHFNVDFLPFEHFVKVYDGPLPVEAGQDMIKDVIIPVGTGAGTSNFVYEGENLVIMAYRADIINYAVENEWHLNPGDEEIHRTRMLYTNTVPSPFTPENPDSSEEYTINYTFASYPKIVFFIEKGAMGTVSGTVTDAITSLPIENAAVYLANIPTVVTITTASGDYIFENIPIERDIEVAAFGYHTQTIPYTEIGWNTTTLTATKNIAMSPLSAGLSISGRVSKGDSGAFTNGITVTLSGYITGETITSTYADNDGYFAFTGLFGEQTYTIALDYPNFHVYTEEIYLESTSVDNLNIVLEEIIRPPLAVTAEIDPANINQTIIKWYNPFWGSTSYTHSRVGVDDGIGVNGPAVFTVAHRYTYDQIIAMGGNAKDIYKVGFIPWDHPGATYKVRVWVTESSIGTFPIGLAPVCEVPVPAVVAQEMNEVVLPILVTVPEGGILYVGYEVDTPGGFPAGVQYDNYFYGFGNLMMFDYEGEDYWSTMVEQAQLLGSWCIYVFELEPEIDSESAPVVLSAIGNTSDGNKRHISYSFSSSNAGVSKDFPHYFIGHTPTRVTRAINGEFEIFRMFENDIIQANPLYTTTSTEINMNRRNMQYIDTGWGGLVDGEPYKYALRTKHAGATYDGGYELSEPRYTNTLFKSELGTVTVNVSKQGQSVAGTVINLQNNNPNTPNQSYILQAEDNGSHTFVVQTFILYDLSVVMTGSPSYFNTHTFTEPQNVLNVSLFATTTIFSEKFNGATMPEGWTNLDVDNDNFAWKFGDIGTSGPGGLFIDTAAFSQSYIYQNYTEISLLPDNWLISPEIALPETEYINFEFLVAAQDHSAPFDRLLVYIAPSDGDTPSWQTFLVNRNLTLGEAGSPDTETLQPGAELLEDHLVVPEITHDGFYKRSYNIPHYGGETVRIAYRHAFCEFRFQVKIANMAVYSADYIPINVSGIVVDEEGEPIRQAIVQITTIPPDYAPTDNNGAFIFTSIPGNANYTVTSTRYSFIDKSVSISTGADNYDVGTIVMVVDPHSEADLTMPAITLLGTNYPNPFNPSTTISYNLAREGFVTIDVYNIRGQRVKTLLQGIHKAGSGKIVWNGQDDIGHDVASGLYFYRMQTGDYSAVRKMLLLK